MLLLTKTFGVNYSLLPMFKMYPAVFPVHIAITAVKTTRTTYKNNSLLLV